MKVSKQDFKRFSKQIILKNIGIAGQKKIFNSKVLVVGAGGLGCPLILYLANSGVGTIGIIDDDKVDLSNLNRQILFSLQDIGKFKVYQAKKIITLPIHQYLSKKHVSYIAQKIKNFYEKK